MTDFGAFVELAPGVDAFFMYHRFSEHMLKNLQTYFQ